MRWLALLLLAGCMPEVDMTVRCHPPTYARFEWTFIEQEGTCGPIAQYDWETGDDKFSGCTGYHGVTQDACVEEWEVSCPWEVEIRGYMDGRTGDGFLSLHRTGSRECRSAYYVSSNGTIVKP